MTRRRARPAGRHRDRPGRRGRGRPSLPYLHRSGWTGVEVARPGLTEHEAEAAGFAAVTETVSSTTRADYFPGAASLTVKVLAEDRSGRLLGARSSVRRRRGRLPQASQLPSDWGRSGHPPGQTYRPMMVMRPAHPPSSGGSIRSAAKARTDFAPLRTPTGTRACRRMSRSFSPSPTAMT